MENENIKKQIDELVKKLSSLKVEEDIIIAVSNSYISKYYLDARLDKALPKEVKNDLKAMLVTITEKYGGVVEVHYVDEDMDIYFKSYAEETDFLYDEIGAQSELSKLQKTHYEMFQNIAACCKVEFRDIK